MQRRSPTTAVPLALGAAGLAGCGIAFLQPGGAASGRHGVASLRGGSQGASPPVHEGAGLAGAALPTAALLAAAAAAAGARASTAVVQRRAEAVKAKKEKKKGVRMVEGKEIPWNLFAPKAPYKGKVISNETITTKTKLPNWETCHVIMNHNKDVPYVEGQSIGIIAPGPDKKGDMPAKVRLYSIASSAPGDDETAATVSLCVKRVLEVEGMGWCEYSNVEPGKDPEFPDAKKVYRGVCSNHICDMKPDQEVLISGPTGAEMLLPDDPNADIIMMATGTGIAPFRSFLRCLFHDKGTAGKFKGRAWLFLGVPFQESLLYDAEWKEMKEKFPDNFRYDYAISSEAAKEGKKKLYVQHRMMEYVDELWDMVKSEKTHIYMCGLKGMESGFAEAFVDKATAEGLDIKEYVKTIKKAKRYHVEVY